MNKKGFSMATAISFLLISVSTFAVDEVESKFLDNLTASGFVLGRSKACGADVEEPLLRLGRVLGRTSSSGPTTDGSYLQVAIQAFQAGEKSQKSGKAPENCTSVLRLYEGIRHLPQ